MKRGDLAARLSLHGVGLPFQKHMMRDAGQEE